MWFRHTCSLPAGADRFCAWVDDYVQATNGSDAPRQERALEYLTGFATDASVAQYALNVPGYQEGVLTPLEQGDLEPAHSFLKACEVHR